MTSSSDALKVRFAPGDTIPVIVRHVSRSGRQRTIDVLDPHSLTSLSIEVADVLGRQLDPGRSGVIVRGGGVNMLVELVNDLGDALYGDRFAFTYNRL